MKLFLSFHSSVEFDHTSYGNSHAVSVLSVGDIKCRGTTLDLAGEERKVHPRCGYEVGERLGPDLTHKRFELFELFLCERRSPESYGEVGLWAGTMERDYAVPAFINTLVEMIEMFSTVDS